jgi:hypothetical protein
MKHSELELKYWETSELAVRSLELDILTAKEELERYGYNLDEGAIVNVIISDGFGKYIPQVLFSRLGIYTADDDYPFEIGSEEEILAFDELLEEIDEELQELVEEYDLVPAGFAVHFGWNDGEIRTMLYPIS